MKKRKRALVNSCCCCYRWPHVEQRAVVSAPGLRREIVASTQVNDARLAAAAAHPGTRGATCASCCVRGARPQTPLLRACRRVRQRPCGHRRIPGGPRYLTRLPFWNPSRACAFVRPADGSHAPGNPLITPVATLVAIFKTKNHLALFQALHLLNCCRPVQRMHKIYKRSIHQFLFRVAQSNLKSGIDLF